MRHFVTGLLIGAGLFIGLWAVPTYAATTKSCVSLEAVKTDLTNHGAAVGELRPELLDRLLAAVRHSKTLHADVVEALNGVDKAYGVFGASDQDHVVVLFVKKNCIVGAIVFDAHELHDILEPSK